MVTDEGGRQRVMTWGDKDAAADRVEELLIIGAQVVRNLRTDDPTSYAQVYYLRTELGRVVATLGVGVPPDLRHIITTIESWKG